jgi:hypothetical protein
MAHMEKPVCRKGPVRKHCCHFDVSYLDMDTSSEFDFIVSTFNSNGGEQPGVRTWNETFF